MILAIWATKVFQFIGFIRLRSQHIQIRSSQSLLGRRSANVSSSPPLSLIEIFFPKKERTDSLHCSDFIAASTVSSRVASRNILRAGRSRPHRVQWPTEMNQRRSRAPRLPLRRRPSSARSMKRWSRRSSRCSGWEALCKRTRTCALSGPRHAASSSRSLAGSPHDETGSIHHYSVKIAKHHERFENHQHFKFRQLVVGFIKETFCERRFIFSIFKHSTNIEIHFKNSARFRNCFATSR